MDRRQIFTGTRIFGLFSFAFGLWLLPVEREVIVTTGRGGRNSAAIPLLICCGLGFLIDPEFKRPGMLAALYFAGAAAGVVWFLRWG